MKTDPRKVHSKATSRKGRKPKTAILGVRLRGEPAPLWHRLAARRL